MNLYLSCYFFTDIFEKIGFADGAANRFLKDFLNNSEDAHIS